MCSGVVCHHPDERPQGRINEIGVAGPWRRQGIATRRVEACVAEAWRRDCTGIQVIADPTHMAEGVWQSLGQGRTGTRRATVTRTLAA